jgi:integrase
VASDRGRDEGTHDRGDVSPKHGEARPARIGGNYVQHLDAARLDRLYLELQAAGLSSSTVATIAATISSALDYAVRKDLVRRNVARSSDPPRARRRRPTTWSPRELAKFLEHVARERDAALWRFLGLSGCRRGEALALTWRTLDLDTGSATIERALVPVSGELVFTAPKTEEGRRLIPLDDETVRILREHRERQLLERSYMGAGYEDGDLVFCHGDGRPLDPRGVSLRFVRLTKAAGLPTIRLHDLRHGVATMGLGAEVHAEVIRRRLGHRDIATTLDTYTHAATEVERAAAMKIAALVDARSEP